MRILVALVFLLTLHGTAAAQINSGSGDAATFVPVTPEAFSQRLDEAAAEYIAEYPAGTFADRFAQIDSAWPRDKIEFVQMGRHAILLVAALSQKAEELPLARVYIRNADGTETELVQLSSVRSELPAGTPTSTFFGVHREDTFFLLPIDPYTRPGELLADFATGRKAFRLSKNYDDTPEFWKQPRGAASTPDPDTAAAMIAREYPGFAIVSPQ